MAGDVELDLRQQLEQLSAELMGTVAPEVVATMREATEKLIESGIVGQALREGERAPDFTLPNAVGKPYHLAAELARGPVVVTFYRGIW